MNMDYRIFDMTACDIEKDQLSDGLVFVCLDDRKINHGYAVRICGVSNSSDKYGRVIKTLGHFYDIQTASRFANMMVLEILAKLQAEIKDRIGAERCHCFDEK